MPKKSLSLRFVIFAILVGNTLEWYDFVLYAYLIPIFLKIFFPSENSALALAYALLVLAIGIALRPIGGVLFGYIGDRFGRRFALITSLSLMTVPVGIISILPSYLQIGLAAPLILTAMRIIQGIAAGGEFPGVMAFLYESSPANQRSFYSSWAFFGVFLGIFVGAIDFYFLVAKMSSSELLQWGWRIPFMVGTILGGIGIFLRRKLHETPLFAHHKSIQGVITHPIFEVFRKHKKEMLRMAGVAFTDAVAFNFIIVFSTTYLVEFVHLSMRQSLLINSFIILTCIAFVPIAGKISVFFTPRKTCMAAAICFILFSWPLFTLLSHSMFLHKFAALILFAIFLSFYLAPLPAILCHIAPTTVRFSTIGIAYNTTIALVGGTTPLLMIHLIKWSGTIIAPCYYLMLAALVSLLVLRTTQEH